ncbi:hypothetical protein SISSUDRAFT_1057376 [Sistotremastrum suecicum HHB10207 ss-3]|uniref:Uncharacterized protein n=1 Tax=Sistotremastrum suecicum HHB10207 ss-3 TaxID=1314776 RepID=A0A166IKP3_9AGAM|nr:hypothetical protein SISSUDRAFT_1057376 [Sistotremastrum suecicum HHB10207 ss-3]
MRPRILAACLALLPSLPSSAGQNSSFTLDFQVQSGGNTNYFFRDDIAAAQILFPNATADSGPQRFVAALPAGNSGALVYFIPRNASTSLSVQAVNRSFTSTVQAFNNTGISGQMSFDNNASMGVAIIGAVRAMRDYVEGGGLTHEIFNYTLGDFNSSYLQLHRHNINGTITSDFIMQTNPNLNLSFSITPGNNGTWTPPKIDFLLPVNATTGYANFTFLTNESSLAPFNTQDLFLQSPPEEASPALINALAGLANGTSSQGDQVSFLTYGNKFTAGGWRFLTYFGRDSLIALRLLSPLLTSDAVETALGAVLERMNSTGALCHEETIGDYASFVNIGNNQSYLGAQPFYDYKMIDTDLYLLPIVSHYFLDLPQGHNRSSAFLAKNATLQNGTYAELLKRNIDYNLARAQAFAHDPTRFDNLLRLRPGQPVGNWRDSNNGLGYGVYPYDVNAALMPAALRAIEALSQQDIIDSKYRSQASSFADTWETHAHNFFSITLNESAASARLNNFIDAANLSVVLLNETMLPKKTSFYALSLKDDGNPVEVLHSDTGETLLFADNVTNDTLSRVAQSLQAYPQGLLTPLGMVVANPAYDSNTSNIHTLDRTQYQGTVVWSWQQGMMAAGLDRQLAFCDASNVTVDFIPSPSNTPAWCQDKQLVSDLQSARTRLWNSINGAPEERFSEVWSYSYNVSTGQWGIADLASISPDGTESDAVQLWSFGFLALADPTAGSG